MSVCFCCFLKAHYFLRTQAEVGYWVYDELVQGGHYCKDREGEIFNGVVWPGKCAFPDYTQEHTRKWWGTLYKGLIQNDGVVSSCITFAFFISALRVHHTGWHLE